MTNSSEHSSLRSTLLSGKKCVKVDFNFTIPVKLSWNHIYRMCCRKIGGRYVPTMFKSSTYREVHSLVALQLRAGGRTFPSNPVAYDVDVVFAFPRKDWLTKAGKLRVVDLLNIWKPLEDMVADTIKINDCLSLRVSLNKEINDLNVREVRTSWNFYLPEVA